MFKVSKNVSVDFLPLHTFVPQNLKTGYNSLLVNPKAYDISA
jgi:hypothetical protein